MNEDRSCPIWGTPADVRLYDGDDKAEINSPRTGGKYNIYSSGRSRLRNCDDRLKARLTSFLIEQRRLGDERPIVDRSVIDSVERKRNLRVHERVDRLLRYIERETSYVGEEISFHIGPEDRIYENMIELENQSTGYWRNMKARAFSESMNEMELIYLLRYGKDKAWIEDGQSDTAFIVTVDGYARLAELEKKGAESSRAFVAMWFDPSLNDAWEKGIRFGIEDAGYEAIRIDNQEHVNKIDDEIVAEIRRSRFVVADFTHGTTGARGGVYYEAGFAHGLDIHVIFTCREDALSEVHFDTRNYNHIVWKTPEELRCKLSRRISAVIGDGPLKGDSG